MSMNKWDDDDDDSNDLRPKLLAELQGLVESLSVIADEGKVIENMNEVCSSLAAAYFEVNEEDLVVIGGRRAVAEAMQAHSNSPTVQAQGIKLLTIMMTDKLVTSEAATFLVDTSLAAMKRFPNDEGVHHSTLDALHTIRRNDEVKHLVKTDVLLDVIAHSFKNFPESKDVVRGAIILLYAVSREKKDDRTKELMVDGFELAAEHGYDVYMYW